MTDVQDTAPISPPPPVPPPPTPPPPTVADEAPTAQQAADPAYNQAVPAPTDRHQKNNPSPSTRRDRHSKFNSDVGDVGSLYLDTGPIASIRFDHYLVL